MPKGLIVLASCHSKDEAKELQSDGWRTARVSEKEDAVAGEAYCPYDLNKSRGKSNDDVNCMTCRLCFAAEVNIVFLKF